MQIRHVLVVAAALSFAGVAVAAPQCTDAPESEWMGEDAMQQQLEDQGYQIDRFVVTDTNCYEIYGEDKDGVKVEIYFDPVNGEAVEEHRND
ncbi:PepSY domain-containing protein [Halomonas sp. PR-M31]|uniref:PepSY domain-containing protein n=1 Tax=Halomonas sp. PR-M31 TaxID=1471202 RepID=UPI000650BC0D|nr:PepSY domain-containing protein [Halomonas sp. PR-M31]